MSSPSEPDTHRRPPRAQVEGHEARALRDGWMAASAAPGSCSGPHQLGSLDWHPARVPGTAAAALRDAGSWRAGDTHDFDGEDWWFRTSFLGARAEADEELVLCLDGIATVAEVYLNGERLLDSVSMFAAHEREVGTLVRDGENELAIACRALGPLLAQRRKPRARWRTRLVEDGNLRFFRTMLLGRTPGIAPGPAAVGPWGEVRLERRRRLVVEELSLRTSCEGATGRLAVRVSLRSLEAAPLAAVEVELRRGSSSFRAPLELKARGETVHAEGELVVAEPTLWWPHTHGEPALYEARLICASASGEVEISAGRVGFRSLGFGAPDHDIELDGLALEVNGVSVFARGCVWTPADPVGLAPSPATLRRALQHMRDAGMNLVRIPGTAAYEQEAFHDLCDELGVLVWQDFMFANLDYPVADEAFRALVAREARQVVGSLAGRPSTAVLCGNSEIEQQVAMLGLDPALGRGELFGVILPEILRASGADAAYVPSTPCGGDLPFRTDRGVSNYYGVGGYRRPLEDARRAEVRFAGECLAFSNVPDEEAIEEMLDGAPAPIVVHDPRWKAGVPRDSGSGWDFEDVRDHYLALLFGVDPGELRRVDHDRYLELSRALTGEVMAEVFGEWRRAGSPCNGGLVLWLGDLRPGAGWGVLDHRGEPKVAYHHLRRALAPVALWTTDEGLGGVEVHCANDGPNPLRGSLRIALYRDFEHPLEEVRELVEIPPHGSAQWNLEAQLGHFVDAGWAYRFGPPAQELIAVSLESEDPLLAGEPGLLSQSFRFPGGGRPLRREPATALALRAAPEQLEGGAVRLTLAAGRFAYGVRLHFPGFEAEDDAFSLEPAHERSILLSPRAPGAVFAGGSLTAINLQGRVRVAAGQHEPAPIDGPGAVAITAGRALGESSR